MILRPPTNSYPHGYYETKLTITPALARLILSSIPVDSYHWDDVERKRAGKLEQYVGILKSGKWEAFDNGHPIRFDKDGNLTHGFVRVWACYEAKCNMDSVVVIPPNSRWSDLLLPETQHADT